MTRYIILLSFTPQGLAKIKESPSRADKFKAAAARVGATVESVFWTLGPYDGVVVLGAPDEAAAVALALELGRAGNVKTTMLRAMDADELGTVLGKMS